MAEPPEDTIIEEREELMVSPTDGEDTPTLRLAHFLKPSFTSIDKPVFNLPSNSLSSSTPNSQPKKPQIPLKISFNGWRNPPKKWQQWVDHMSSLHKTLWKKVGIFESIMNSTYSIPKDPELVSKIAEKWCPQTKTFVFPSGESTVTLEDMFILGNYSVLGDSVLTPLENRGLEEIREKLLETRLEIVRSRSQKATQSAWINKFMESGSEIEHEAFLTLWLSRFVFPAPSYDTIAKNVFPIAVLLASGTKIALAPAVLASLYRDMDLLKQKIMNVGRECEDGVSELTIWAPFQLFQVWIWERFPKFRPKPNWIDYGKTRLAKWHMVKKLNIENEELGIEGFLWRPYAMDVEDVDLRYKFYSHKEKWVQVGLGLYEELDSFVRCLRGCELIGVDCVEQYFPHRVARQFGLDQDLPGNVVLGSNGSHEIAWENYSRPIGDAKLYVPSRLFESGVTTRYLEWWKKLMYAQNDSVKVSETKRAQPRSVYKGPIDVEDRRTLTQLFKKAKSGDNNNQLSSMSDNGSSQSVEEIMSMGEKIGSDDRVVEESEMVVEDAKESRAGTPVLDNVVRIDSNETEGIADSGEEILGLELEARIMKLERVIAKLKEARFGNR